MRVSYCVISRLVHQVFATVFCYKVRPYTCSMLINGMLYNETVVLDMENNTI